MNFQFFNKNITIGNFRNNLIYETKINNWSNQQFVNIDFKIIKNIYLKMKQNNDALQDVK